MKFTVTTLFHLLLSAELLFCITKEVEAGNLSSDVATKLEELYYNYRDAVSSALKYRYSLKDRRHS